jgi:hypothetical protein
MTASESLKPSPEHKNSYQALFNALKIEGVNWCSWKSNEHFAAGLSGETDTDLLFDPAQRKKTIKAFRDSGFVIFHAPHRLSYPGIIDAVALDTKTGNILHAHSHFMLCAGEKYLKSTILPWDNHILKNRVFADGAYMARPEDEAVLLLTRAALKLRWRDIKNLDPKALYGGSGFNAELEWVKERTSADRIAKTGAELLNEKAGEIIGKLISDGFTGERLMALRDQALNISAERGWRRMGNFEGTVQAWWREAGYFFIRATEKLGLETTIIKRRVLPGGGIVVAFLGADGSGKSTVTKTIVEEWSRKIDVRYVYFGTGDGPQSLLQKFIKFLVRIKKDLSSSKPSEEKSEEKTPSSDGPSLATILMAVAGVLHKKALMRRVRILKKKGIIVICDRWPQNQLPGKNDGKMLGALIEDENGFLRKLAAWESREFDRMSAKNSPDIVIKLPVSLETSLARKQENSAMAPLIGSKLEAINLLQFPGADVRTVDANRGLTQVLEEVRGIIWQAVLKQPVPKISVYECVGLPGTGKTTLAKSLCSERGLSTVEEIFLGPENKILLTLRSLISLPLAYALIIKFIIQNSLWHNRYSMDLLLRLPAQKTRLQKAAQQKTYFIEQLLLQNIWSALVDADINRVRAEDLAPVIRALYADFEPVVFHLEANPETSAERVAGRTDGVSRFDGLAEDQIEHEIESSRALMDDIVRAARFSGLNVVTINAAQDVVPVKREVLNHF